MCVLEGEGGTEYSVCTHRICIHLVKVLCVQYVYVSLHVQMYFGVCMCVCV